MITTVPKLLQYYFNSRFIVQLTVSAQKNDYHMSLVQLSYDIKRENFLSVKVTILTIMSSVEV